MDDRGFRLDGMRFDSILNLREMGGLATPDGRVRSGLLYRSGHLSTATDADVDRLAGLGLRTVVDFRSAVDHRGDGGPDRLPDGVDHVHLDLTDGSENAAEIRSTLLSGDQALIDATFGDGRAERIATEAVEVMALDPGKQRVFGRFLATVADPGRRPVLWHCSAGKDRAGWAATLLGMALGIDDDTLLDHYLESNVHRPPEQRIAFYRERFGVDITPARPLLMVDEPYLRAGLAAVDAGWATREDYLADALGFGPEQVAQLRTELVE